MTSLSTMEGLDLNLIKEKFGEPISNKLQINCKKYINNFKLKEADSRLILTTEGKLFADGIAADLFF